MPEGIKAMRIKGALSTLQPLKFLDFYTVCRVGFRSRRSPSPCNQRRNALPHVGAF
jgi:hypothetical protein